MTYCEDSDMPYIVRFKQGDVVLDNGQLHMVVKSLPPSDNDLPFQAVTLTGECAGNYHVRYRDGCRLVPAVVHIPSQV